MVVATGDGIFRKQTTVGTVGVGLWLDYGVRLTLSVNLDTHDMHPRERAQREVAVAQQRLSCNVCGPCEVWTDGYGYGRAMHGTSTSNED
jgi:hypothetical protein